MCPLRIIYFFVLIEIVNMEYAMTSKIKIIKPNRVNTPIFIPCVIGASGFP